VYCLGVSVRIAQFLKIGFLALEIMALAAPKTVSSGKTFFSTVVCVLSSQVEIPVFGYIKSVITTLPLFAL